MSFANLCLKSGNPTVDLFLSRISHQVAQYVAWKPLQRNRGRNVNSLDTGSLLRISLILHDPPCTKQNTPRPRTHMTLITSCWQTQLWYPHGNANKETNSNTKFSHTFSRSKKESPSISVEQSLILVVWQISVRDYLSREFLRKQPSLLPSQEGKVLWEISNRPGRSGLAGVTHGKLIHYDAL